MPSLAMSGRLPVGDSLEVVAESSDAEGTETRQWENRAEIVPPQNRQRAEAIQAWLVAKLAQQLGIRAQEIDIGERFVEYGLDSMAAVNLSTDLSDWLGRPLAPTLAYNYPTITALAQYCHHLCRLWLPSQRLLPLLRHGRGNFTGYNGAKKKLTIFKIFQMDALEQNQVLILHDAAPKSTATAEGQMVRTLVGCGQNLIAGQSRSQQLLIVDPDTFTPCPEQQVGEIWVQGPNVAQGYWNQTEATRETFHAYLATHPLPLSRGESTPDGPFLRTGHLAFFFTVNYSLRVV